MNRLFNSIFLGGDEYVSCSASFLPAGNLENGRDVGVEQIQSPVDAVRIKVKHVPIPTLACACRPPQLPQVCVIKASQRINVGEQNLISTIASNIRMHVTHFLFFPPTVEEVFNLCLINLLVLLIVILFRC